VDTKATVLVSAQRTPSGYLGGLATGTAVRSVELEPGASASALFEGLTGPLPARPPCPQYAALAVTPPNETHAVRIPSSYSLCYLEVHPITAGTSGGTNAP